MEDKDIFEKVESDIIPEQAIIEAIVKLAEKVRDNHAVEERQNTEQVARNKALDNADIVIDEFCSNASYEEDKSTPSCNVMFACQYCLFFVWRFDLYFQKIVNVVN